MASEAETAEATDWHCRRFAELSPRVLYRLLRLRADVFVVEQGCAYQDLDGVDLDPRTEHLWAERDGEVIAYLRLLAEPPAPARLGRVAVARQSRGAGLAGELMRRALERCSGDVVLEAQSQVVPWYSRLGFQPTGPEYREDGIAHVPMRRPQRPATSS